MTPNANDAIRRRADGSIDTGFYLARGRAARCRQTYNLIGALSRWAGRIGSNLNRHLNVANPTSDLRYRMRPKLG